MLRNLAIGLTLLAFSGAVLAEGKVYYKRGFSDTDRLLVTDGGDINGDFPVSTSSITVASIQKLLKSNEELSNQINDLVRDNKDLAKKLDDLSRENDDLNRKVSDLSSKIK